MASLSPAPRETGEELRYGEAREDGDTDLEMGDRGREARRDLWNESGYWSSTER